MNNDERPYVSLVQTDRPPQDEHHDAVQLLVIDLLRRFTGTLVRALSDASHAHEMIVSQAVMEKAYFTSLYGSLKLMGTTEVADFLALKNRQRVDQMRKAPSLKFPMPVAELRQGPVWLARDIEKFAETWERKPGRPKKETKE